MNEEMTLESIYELENTIRKYVDETEGEELTSIIMYKVLLFSLSLKGYNENILHNKCWEYFYRNKDKLIEVIP